MKITKEINPDWNDYYLSFAYEQLSRYGHIYLDWQGLPVDNMEETDRIGNISRFYET